MVIHREFTIRQLRDVTQRLQQRDVAQVECDRRQLCARRRLQQDLAFWSILLAVAILLAFVIYSVNKRIKAAIPTPPTSSRFDLFQRIEKAPQKPPRR